MAEILPNAASVPTVNTAKACKNTVVVEPKDCLQTGIVMTNCELAVGAVGRESALSPPVPNDDPVMLTPPANVVPVMAAALYATIPVMSHTPAVKLIEVTVVTVLFNTPTAEPEAIVALICSPSCPEDGAVLARFP